jgi:hypothetical protein
LLPNGGVIVFLGRDLEGYPNHPDGK